MKIGRKKVSTTTIVAMVIMVVVVIAGISVAVLLAPALESNLVQAENLLNSSLEKTYKAVERWDENDFASARIKLAGAKSDVEEARKLLEKIDFEPVKKQAIVLMMDGWQSYIVCLDHLNNSFEDYYQGTLRWSYQDWDGVITKFLDAKEDVEQAQTYFLSAKENFNQLNLETLSPEFKSSVVETRAFFAEYEKLLPDFSNTIDALIPFVRGMKILLEGATYLDRQDWVSAEIAFKDSLLKVNEAKNKFDNLRYCQTASYSSLASKMFINLQTLETALSHYIRGCQYAEAGNVASASSEFETGNQLLGGISWG